MSSFKDFPLLVFSLLSGFLIAGLFLWNMSANMPGASFTGEAWAILEFDEAEDDRLIGEALSAGSFSTFYSESNQVIYFDDFGVLKEAALDSFDDVLEPYDPRNDGYAGKLKSLFVRDGKRYFFVHISDARDIKKLENAVEGFPCKIEVLGSGRNPAFNLILGPVALLAALFLSREKRRFIWQIPLLLAFVWTGPQGIILAALLTGLRGLLREVWVEFLSKSYGSLKERLGPYRLHFVFAFILLVFFSLVCVFGEMPLLPVLSGFVIFCLLEFLSVKSERKRIQRIRFAAVWMLPKEAKVPVFRLSLVPFAVAAIILLLVPVFWPGLASTPGDVPFVIEDYVSPEDFEKHIAFQLSFFDNPVGFSGLNLEYYIDGDGLVSANPAGDQSQAVAVPSFPLEKFRHFLVEYTKGSEKVSYIPIDWISTGLLLVIIVSGAFRYGNGYSGKRKTSLSLERQAAA